MLSIFTQKTWCYEKASLMREFGQYTCSLYLIYQCIRYHWSLQRIVWVDWHGKGLFHFYEQILAHSNNWKSLHCPAQKFRRWAAVGFARKRTNRNGLVVVGRQYVQHFLITIDSIVTEKWELRRLHRMLIVEPCRVYYCSVNCNCHLVSSRSILLSQRCKLQSTVYI